ncbi:MAG: transcription antitermination factor NusB [bacterium]
MSSNPQKLNRRRRARELAMRALYAHEMSGNPIESVIKEMIQGNADEHERVLAFAATLVHACVENQAEIEKLIIEQAHNWDFDRIAVLDRLIMRMGICEFLYFEDIPPKVSIDEAIEISKKYSTEKSGTFINGILDGVLLHLRRDKRLTKSGRGLHE